MLNHLERAIQMLDNSPKAALTRFGRDADETYEVSVSNEDYGAVWIVRQTSVEGTTYKLGASDPIITNRWDEIVCPEAVNFWQTLSQRYNAS